jgi:hypothetical protein
MKDFLIFWLSILPVSIEYRYTVHSDTSAVFFFKHCPYPSPFSFYNRILIGNLEDDCVRVLR